jgi:hypothetical protein
MQQWLLLALFLWATVLLIATAWTFFRPGSNTVLSTYPSGVELAGPVTGGRLTYRIVQWLRDPSNPRPCPLVLHLPGGDLRGDALCAWSAPAAAEQLGSPVGLDIFLFHNGGKAVGVRVGLLPGGRRIELSITGVRFSLPLAEDEAVRLLGEPSRRILYDSLGRPRPTDP